MNVLGQYLDRRDDDHQADRTARAASGRDQAREDSFRIWLDAGRRPEERLLKFDAWLRAELLARLVWPAEEGKARRQLEQARVYLERVVLELWRRGWCLDGKALASRLTELLDAVGKYQRAGKVAEFWPYFRATVDRYVGLNAEELREQAMRAGTHVSQFLAALGRHAGPSIGDLIQERYQETLRAKISAERAKQARCKADADQPQLF